MVFPLTSNHWFKPIVPGSVMVAPASNNTRVLPCKNLLLMALNKPVVPVKLGKLPVGPTVITRGKASEI